MSSNPEKRNALTTSPSSTSKALITNASPQNESSITSPSSKSILAGNNLSLTFTKSDTSSNVSGKMPVFSGSYGSSNRTLESQAINYYTRISWFNQLKALLWNTYRIRMYYFKTTLFELFLPFILVIPFFLYLSNKDILTLLFSDSPRIQNNVILETHFYKEELLKVNTSAQLELFGFEWFYAPRTNYAKHLYEGFVSNGSFMGLDSEVELNHELQTSFNRVGAFFMNLDDEHLKNVDVQYELKHVENRDQQSKLYQLRKGIQEETVSLFQQIHINDAYMKLICQLLARSCEQIRPIIIKIFRFPTPEMSEHTVSMFKTKLFNPYHLFWCVYLLWIRHLIIQPIIDKDSGKKAYLYTIGISNFLFWLSHFVVNFALTSIFALFFTIVFKVVSFIVTIPFWLLFLLIILNFCQLILYSLFITTFFPGTVTACVGYLVSIYSVNVLINYGNKDSFLKIVSLSLTPVGSSKYMFDILLEHEERGKSIGFGGISQSSFHYEQMSMLTIVQAIIFSCFMYLVLIFYFDNVWPFQKLSKKLTFCISLHYWFPNFAKQRLFPRESENRDKDPSYFEFYEKTDQPVICLEKVVVRFKSVVLNKIDFKMYPNQLTVLLGHNGAGKSTLIHVITGMLNTTSGKVYINGYDICSQSTRARANLSFCPQTNILISQLTVYEHLRFFGMLTIANQAVIDIRIDTVLRSLLFVSKKHELATDLSEGMKRTLNLATALIADANTIILDEPTSGMDPDRRRNVWDTLLNMKREKNIFLTTHYMDEAEFLADRIIIMNKGCVVCDGSPDFLKTSLGSGYFMKVSKAPRFDSKGFLKFVQTFVPAASELSDTGPELSISLKNDMGKQESMAHLILLLESIEKQQELLKIESFGLSYSTIEDVFISVERNELSPSDRIDLQYDEDDDSLIPQDLATGFDLWYQQFVAIIVRRIHFFRRSWSSILLQVILPIAILLFYVYSKPLDSTIQTSELKMNLKHIYSKNMKAFYYGENTLKQEFKSILRSNDAQMSFSTNSRNLEHISKSILKSTENDLLEYKYHDSFGLGVFGNEYHIWINLYHFYSLPIALNILYEMIFCSVFDELKTNSSCKGIDFYHSTIKYVGNQIDQPDPFSKEVVNSYRKMTMICIYGLLSIILLESVFRFVIEDRETKSQFLQKLFTVSPALYWFANFFVDFLCFFGMMMIAFIIFQGFEMNNIFVGEQTNTTYTVTWLLLLICSLGTIPCAYCFTYFVRDHLVLYYLYLALSIILIFQIFLSESSQIAYKASEYGLADIFYFIFDICPIFSFLMACQKIFTLESYHLSCHKKQADAKYIETICHSNITTLKFCCPQPFCGTNCVMEFGILSANRYGALVEIIMLIISSFGWWILLYFIEEGLLSACCVPYPAAVDDPKKNADNDVLEEYERVERDVRKPQQDNALTIYHLSKDFSCIAAVNDLTFGVRKEECFGLIGINGAGKTTTFSLLAGEISPTSGDVFIGPNKISLSNNLREYQSKISYCPHVDSLLEEMTGRETIYFYAKLRGIPVEHMKKTITKILHMLGIHNDAKEQIKNLNCGAKRKISIAISLLGNPLVIMLDEPSSGIDPIGRRMLAKTLATIRRKTKCSIILSSHTMDEAETVCSRIGVMFKGSLKCIGSPQHLRELYAQGFSVIIRVDKKFSDNQLYNNKIKRVFSKIMPTAIMKDFHHNLLYYSLPDPALKWSQAFKTLVTLDKKFNFEDFIISAASLDQIFLKFPN